ncbi:hypothetical protein, partial [Cryobacterium algoritolerans]|uniref:hypothetical protein n=1 Tax=Cryobacterium algoritolerans TaxID=1259184 RepID=UPI001A7E4E87
DRPARPARTTGPHDRPARPARTTGQARPIRQRWPGITERSALAPARCPRTGSPQAFPVAEGPRSPVALTGTGAAPHTRTPAH